MTQPQFSLRIALKWLDDNIVLILAAFLFAFIPLWPKIPLYSPIEQYIVRVRLEDLFLFGTVVVFFIQFLRQKVKWRSSMTWMIAAYAVVSLLSVLVAIFITHTVPLEKMNLEKTFLHYFRYLEYFSFFFVLFAAVRKRRDVFIFLAIFALTVIGVSIYGYGQRYWYWCVYSTMNREFSKGECLYLTPNARVQSTFAGDYDMAAYLVIALPLLLAVAYQVKNKYVKYFFHGAFWIGTWLIIESASRSSFLAFLVSLGLVILFSGWQRTGWASRAKFVLSRGFLTFALCGIIFFIFGAQLNDRLTQVIDSNQTIHDTFHSLNRQRKELIASILGQKPSASNEVVKPATPPPNGISTDQAIAMGILNPTDEQPIAATPAPTPKTIAQPNPTPVDVYVNVPDIKLVATTSASGVTTQVPTEVPRVYSANALKYGLSMAIRLDTLWPNAIKGFMSDPIFGKGYATLNKENVNDFTYADSTDNNFLRTLGETGLLGFITFYGCVGVVLYISARAVRDGDYLEKAMGIGVAAGTVGLLINAVYIDVFASSKVALTYWAVAGILLSFYAIQHHRSITVEKMPVVENPVKTPTMNAKSKKKKFKKAK